MTENTKELEELRKKFIKSEDGELENLKEAVKELSAYGQVYSDGHIKLNLEQIGKITMKGKIELIAALRFVANRLEKKLNIETKITETLTGEEIAKFLGANPKVITARLNDLKGERKLISPSRGLFSIIPHRVDEIVREIKRDGGLNGY